MIYIYIYGIRNGVGKLTTIDVTKIVKCRMMYVNDRVETIVRKNMSFMIVNKLSTKQQ